MALGTAGMAPVRYERSSWNMYQPYYPEVEDHLPKDPRQWTRDDVATWVKFLTSQHRLPEVPIGRFLMNGKALCLMTPSMFLDRVPLGGKLFYKDFQLRLSAYLYSN
ncbi:transcription factor ETV6 [Harmonia axyridis]|uniref:transcription factor ETV6 n=1 Tax=Harmonia axyridis TaxID=115357 RepID=UPI001E2792EB|nr:transcription factor ETV6 [Harmonia axyridis]XP_045469207.1 transcription factor ETV6 [Harmonia axyridis]